jgi:Tfp pilus assembly protein PilX
MGSISKEKREEQKEMAAKALEACKTELQEAGLSEKEMERKPMFRQAKAALKKANQRLMAIDAKAEHIKTAAENKDKNKVKTKPKDQKKGGAQGKQKNAKKDGKKDGKAKPKKKK